jgi:hypothetical protein
MSEFVTPEKAREMGLQQLTFRQILDESLRYWEPRRIPYNLALAGVCLVAYLNGFPMGGVNLMSLFSLMVLAVLANLCYCTAYVPDLVLQYSGFRAFWLRLRPLLFWFGMVLAVLLAMLITMPSWLMIF